jgi:hypothetical protein
VIELKALMKSYFEDVNLGSAKTFTNTIAHIESLKKWLNQGTHKRTQQKQPCPATKHTKLAASLQVISNKLHFGRAVEEAQEEIQRKRFRYYQRHKETTSTLVDSVKSVESIKENIKNGLEHQAGPSAAPKLASEQLHEKTFIVQ